MSDPLKLLVVDDNEAGRYVKRRILEQAGYEVHEAHEGFDALRIIVAAKPALVLLDVNLPDISGVELCRKLRANQVDIAVLMTSAAFVDPADRAAALDSGADSYLIEPIDPNELVASVRSLLRLRVAENNLRDANDMLAHKIAEQSRALIEVTDNLAAERENVARAQEALWHSQKLEAIGRLTGGIAHDFNNLLTVILGNLEIVEHGLKRAAEGNSIASDKLLRHAQSSRRAALDCTNIVRQLLVFARRDPSRMTVVDIGEAIARLEDFVRRSVGEAVAIEFALRPNLAPSKIDVAHFEAAILNLAINARDAMPTGGTLRITSAVAHVSSGAAISAGDAPVPADIVPGDYVVITVADTGSGMDKDITPHVFEPFFTTKDIGKGSGLGLSQVFGFVKQSNGYIALDTAPGKGTRFGIFLPLAVVEQADDRSAAPRPARDLPHGKGTILVVEDNDLVLDYVAEMTKELGYRVLRARSSSEALAVVRGGEEINLLFTDVVMPNGMSGIDLALEVRRLRPDIKILITSGYPGRAISDKRSADFMSILKPYSGADLAHRLQEAMAN